MGYPGKSLWPLLSTKNLSESDVKPLGPKILTYGNFDPKELCLC